ncbi:MULTISPECIES: class I SAM-dependent methyltransferase [Streptomyces]|nr:methyltransferase domain-containing protein [Streptomyces nigrescens]MEE4423540.1 methyltransferase domain-containing protein [Streptomyces sp. DSM 41528]
MTDARREAQRIFDTLASEYDRSGVDYFGPVGERLVALVKIGSGESVLDIGCGRGAVLFHAARAVGEHGRVVGVDLSTAMVEAVRKEARASEMPQVEAMVGEGQSPPFPEQSFDVVTGGMSVHMLADIPAALRAYHQVLRPRGRLGLSAPATVERPAPEVFGLRSIARFSAAHDAGSGIYPYTEAFGGARRLRGDLLAAGFEEVEVLEEPAFICTDSAERFLRWTWTHGMRKLWERVSPDERRRAERAITTEARARSERTDRIVLRTPVMYVTAVRPALHATAGPSDRDPA